MRFDGKDNKQRAKALKIGELSGVTAPAVPGSVATFMKAASIEQLLGVAIDDEKKDELEAMLRDPMNGKTLEDRIKTVRSKITKKPAAEDDKMSLTEKQIAELQFLAGASDVVKAHYHTLSSDAERDAYVAKSADEQLSVAEFAKGVDETYVTSEGTTLSKMAMGDATFTMMKQMDERIVKMQVEQEMQKFAKVADDDAHKHLPGETMAKAAVLRHIDGMPQDVQKSLKEMLSAGNAALAKSFEPAASGHTFAKSAEDKLETMAKARAEEKNIPYAQAYNEVLDTAEGQAAYNEVMGA